MTSISIDTDQYQNPSSRRRVTAAALALGGPEGRIDDLSSALIFIHCAIIPFSIIFYRGHALYPSAVGPRLLAALLVLEIQQDCIYIYIYIYIIFIYIIYIK